MLRSPPPVVEWSVVEPSILVEIVCTPGLVSGAKVRIIVCTLPITIVRILPITRVRITLSIIVIVVRIIVRPVAVVRIASNYI